MRYGNKTCSSCGREIKGCGKTGKCISCLAKERLSNPENCPNYKGGRKVYCCDCGKQLCKGAYWQGSKRCANCDDKFRARKISKKEYAYQYYRKNITKFAEYNKKRYLDKGTEYWNELKRKRYATPEGKKKMDARFKAWKEKNRVKVKCHMKLNIAVVGGKVIVPKNCSICGQEKKLVAHHENYEKPLEVVWCCAMCHKAIHRAREVA